MSESQRAADSGHVLKNKIALAVVVYFVVGYSVLIGAMQNRYEYDFTNLCAQSADYPVAVISSPVWPFILVREYIQLRYWPVPRLRFDKSRMKGCAR